MKFDSILGTVGNTPVVKINKLAPKGINLYVKIEAFNPLGSVKDRLALGVIEAAEKDGSLVIAGSGKAGETVEVYADDKLLGETPVESTGDWVFVPDHPVAQ